MQSKIQLDLFTEEDELSLMRKELKEVYLQFEKLKRALYVRHQDLSRLCLQLKEENEQLKYRLDKLESVIQKQSKSSNDDLLEKLFKEAYLLSS
ncbi:hypothetical protein [Candidatus Protochlamydia phocaeensis]|uniref:hypothetical protein n=1 Tax=Candidatus Protochlamydia phocaeensis TaxID=1414722 RepID=UPI0008399631|nr:hypothetical protein [Candidatus Protochlamydia phocaeensis]